MTPEQEEKMMKAFKDTLENVRLNSLRTGARMICGAVLAYASRDGTDSEKLKEIVDFCNSTLGRAKIDEVES